MILEDRLVQLCEDIGSPFATSVANLLREKKWEALARLEVIPYDYTEADAYLLDASLAALFQKNVDLPTGVDRKLAAKTKWFESEAICYQTNRRFSNYRTGYYPDVSWRLVAFCDRVQNRIASILGRLPLDIQGRFGPGSVFEAAEKLGSSVRSLTAVDKTSCISGTRGAHELLSVPGLQDRITCPEKFGQERVVHTVRGSRWTSVPKNALLERSIALEPGLNVYLQLGVEVPLWDRLGALGIRKADAQSWHRYLAKHALTLGLATLDESMASDLWAAEAVRFLLAKAPLWLSLLESLRCSKMQVEGKWVHLEKFSSMGNGFTFPLQTILFYAITREVCGEDALVAVFGDDIICPRECAVDVMAALKWFGHKPNLKKSYHEGLFRESCGEDFFAGQPVRPHFVEHWPTEPLDWYSLSNGILRRAGHLRAFRGFALWCARQVPLRYRFGGPEELGDSVLHILKRRAVTRERHCIRQVRGLKRLTRRVNIDHFDSRDLLATVLLGAVSLSYSSRLSRTVAYAPTRGVSGWKAGWFTVLGA